MTATAKHLLISKASAELVEELLENSRKEGGELWFHIIERKLNGFLKALHTHEQGPGQQGERAKRARRVIRTEEIRDPQPTRRLPVGRK